MAARRREVPAKPGRLRLPAHDGPAHDRLREWLARDAAAGAHVERRRCAVRQAVLDNAPTVQRPNFASLADTDVVTAIAAVDTVWFDGALQQCVAERDGLLVASVSRRMTSTGGKTLVAYTSAGRWRFEIRLATAPLFRSFREDEPAPNRPVTVNGVPCRDRLDAALLTVEHEALHLAEFLCFGDSSCSQDRFRHAARRLFGHTESTHEMVSAGERAHRAFGVRTGDHVAFEFDGCRHEGFVNRITKRATVLVPSPHGARYADGKRYLKFYVPLAALVPLK